MLNFVLQTPSLQHLAGIKLAAALWNHPDILTQLAEQTEGAVDQVWIKWKSIAAQVKANASTLELTQVCKQQLSNFIYPLALEMFKWCMHHYIDEVGTRSENDDLVFLNCSLQKQFCWTMHGVVDYAKTAELLLKDERALDVEKRYEIACANCLENQARELIKLVPEVKLQEYMRRDGINGMYLMQFFTCTLRGDVDHFQKIISLPEGASINHLLFLRGMHSFQPAMCEYFYDKLTQREKEQVLGDSAMAILDSCKDISHCNVLYYLSRMNEEQQERVFRECISDVLICLLGWPMQSLFMEAAECCRRYEMVDGDYEKVLGAIAHKIVKHHSGYNYSLLFSQFWQLTPVEVQRRLLDNVGFLKKVFETKKNEIIYSIFSEASLRQISALEDKIDAKERAKFQLVKEKCIRESKELSRTKRRRLI